MITRSSKLSLMLVYQLTYNTMRSEVPSFEHIFDQDEQLPLFITARRPRVCTRALH